MPAIDYSKVAHLYDAYVRTELDFAFFLNEAKGAAKVLELMSGTGRLSIPMLEAGVNLTCIDSSLQMLAILRRKLAEKGFYASVLEMDVCNLSLPEKYDLIIIPFHSFAEITNPDDQRKALAAIHKSLKNDGRFICTLHNPAARLKQITGQIVERGKFLLLDETGTLILSSIESLDAVSKIVSGTQFYEIYDKNGILAEKLSVDIRFCLHGKNEFEELAKSAGFEIVKMHGDYSYTSFDENMSPFMIFDLEPIILSC